MITPKVLKEYLTQWQNEIWSGGVLCVIESYDRSNQSAKIKPLYKIKDKSNSIELPILIEIPVMNFENNEIQFVWDYKKGDIVQAIPNVAQTEFAIKGITDNLGNSRYKLSNCIIIGGISKRPITVNPLLPSTGFLIANKNTGDYIQITDSIKIKSGTDSLEKSLKGETLIDVLKSILDAIGDFTVMTPVGPSSPIKSIPTNLTKLTTLKADLETALSKKLESN